MNHVHLQKAPEAFPSSLASFVNRLITSLKQTWQGLEDPPVHVGSALDAPSHESLWKVTGTLTCQAGFGRLTAESRHCIQAATREAALAEATQRMLEAHPDFAISSLKAVKAAEG